MLCAGVTKKVMNNGLTILVKENHAAPVVAIVSYVKAGYFNEPDRIVGISHLMEHMFFKGTQTRGVGQIAHETKALGGYLNASTLYDHTLYYTVLPSENFIQGLDIQSDALINSIFDPEEMRKETEVVIQEAKRKLDIPAALVLEKMFELAFEKHRMRRWRIGTEEGLRALTREDFLTFHKNLYRPENIILVVVGDIETQTALEEIEKYYYNLDKGIMVKEESPPEQPQEKFKYKQLRGDIQQSYLTIGFHTAEILHPDTYAVEIGGFILGHGRSCRLFQKVREEAKLVDTISASNYALKDVGIFEIEATCKSENLRKAEWAIFEEIEKMRQNPVEEVELIKARNSLESRYIFYMESASGQANILATYEALGDYRLAEAYLKKLYQVTQEDIIRVIEKYFTLSNCSLLEYVPNNVDLQPSSPQEMASVIKKTFSPKTSEPLSVSRKSDSIEEVFTYIPNTVPDKEMTRYVLSNGLTLLIKENHQIPLVAAGIYAKGGRSSEDSDNSGISGLTVRSALKGTRNRSASEIALEIEKLGSTILTSNAPDYFGFSMSILSKHFRAGWEVLADIITEPTFPEEEVAKGKENTLAQIMREKDDMFRHPIELFYSALFKNHPYGFPIHGNPNLIKKITTKNLQTWYRQHFTPNNMIAVFVGDLESNWLKDEVESRFSHSESPHNGPFKSYNLMPPSKIEEKSEQREKEQTAMALGFLGPKYTEDEYYPLTVLQNIVSGLGGRFFEELRGRQSLAYHVAAFLVARAFGGAFISYIATSPENETVAKNGLLKEFEKLTKEPVTEKELKLSIQYTVGTYEIGLETYRSQMIQYLHNEILGKGIEEVASFFSKIKQVTREEILEAARKYFNPNRFAVGMVRGRANDKKGNY
ncbi:MAG: M16 family metallopeptidase [bacterium]